MSSLSISLKKKIGANLSLTIYNMENFQRIVVTGQNYDDELPASYITKALYIEDLSMDSSFVAWEMMRPNKHSKKLTLAYVEDINPDPSCTTRSREWDTIGHQWCMTLWSMLRLVKHVNSTPITYTSLQNPYTLLLHLGLLKHGVLTWLDLYQSPLWVTYTYW